MNRRTRNLLGAVSAGVLALAGFSDFSHARYLQADPTGLAAGPNLYGYAAQNPTEAIDPSGRACIAGDLFVTCQDSEDGGPVVTFAKPGSDWPDYFNSHTLFYHHYDEAVSSPDPCPDLLQSVIDNPTPGPSNNSATAEGTPNDATPNYLSWLGRSPVMSFTTTLQNGDTAVLNVTQQDHPLYPGYVVRVVSKNADGGVTLHNYGEGTNYKQAPGTFIAPLIDSVWIQQSKDLMRK